MRDVEHIQRNKHTRFVYLWRLALPVEPHAIQPGAMHSSEQSAFERDFEGSTKGHNSRRMISSAHLRRRVVVEPTGGVLEPTGAILEPTGALLESTIAVLAPTCAVLVPTGAGLEPVCCVLLEPTSTFWNPQALFGSPQALF